MASTGVAPAPSRAIIGPVFTSAGFQYWYLACFPDCIVAVPQGIGTGLALAMSNGVAASVFGLLGALLNYFVRDRVQQLRQRIVAQLETTPTSTLRASPNVVYQVSQLRAVMVKPVKNGGGLITPDIILVTASGKKKYGIQQADFTKACTELKQPYPSLCKSF